jgi:hypothetical protein
MAGADTLDAQLGTGEEGAGTYGTAVTRTRFVEFLSETVKKDKTRILSNGLRAGGSKVQPKSAPSGSVRCSGDIELELQNKGLGLLLKHIFGSVVTSQPDAGGNPTVYDHTYTPASVAGKSLSIETAWLDDAAAAHSKLITGAKVSSAEFSVKANELSLLKASINAQNVSTADSKTTASYASAIRQFGSASVVLTLAGSSITAEDAVVTYNNQLDTKDYLGNAGLQDAPLTLEKLGIEVVVNAPWVSWAAYNRLDSDTEVALVIKSEGAVISGAYKFMHQITMNVRTDGETPGVSGRERISQPLKFTATGDTPGEALTYLFRTTDATP